MFRIIIIALTEKSNVFKLVAKERLSSLNKETPMQEYMALI